MMHLACERWARLTDTRLRLHVSYDMLIGDAWSFELLRRQLLLYYKQPYAFLIQIGDKPVAVMPVAADGKKQ